MMAAFRKALRKLAERIDALSLRERGIMFVTVLVVLYFAASGLVFGPLHAQQQRMENELKAKYGQIATINAQVQQTIHAATRDPDKENEARLKVLHGQLERLDPQLANVTQALVSPRDMARFVEQVLTRNKALQVLRVESIPPAPVDAAGNSNPAAVDNGVYKHGMRIEVRGRYLDIVKYLRALESMPWKVFWGQVTLESDDYPMSRLTLVIYTLSLRQGWIGI
jgi:MSHA biogenesis protein MshJ